MNILELFAHIGLQADQQKAENFLSTIGGIKLNLVAATVSVAAFGAAIKKVINDSMGLALEYKKFEAETGASVETLQRWQLAADQASGSGKAVAESIKAIVSNQERIKLGEGNISGYQLLGLSPNADPFEVLEKLRTKISGMSQGMKKNILSKFGISSELLPVLSMSKKKFDEIANSANIISPKMMKQIDEGRQKLAKMNQTIDYYKAVLATKIIPIIERVALVVERGALMIDKMVRNTIGWGNAIKAVVGILIAMNAAIIASPIGAFIAGITALFLIMEDLYVFSTGGKSFFGYLLKNFPMLKTMFDALKDLGTAVKLLFSGDTSGFDKIIEKWGIWGEIIKGIASALKTIKEFFDSKAGKEISGGAKGIITSAFGGGGGYIGETGKEGPTVASSIRDLGTGLLRAMGFDSLADKLKQNYGSGTIVQPQINVYGVTDPEAAGRAAAREVDKVLRNAEANQNRSWRDIR